MLKDILDLRFAFLLPAMGMAGEDDEEDEGEDEEEDEDDVDEEEDEFNKKTPSETKARDPRIKAANDEAKKYRLRSKELARKLREKEKAEEERAEKEKPEIDRLRNQVAGRERVERERDELKLRAAVLEKAIEYKVSGDVDYLEYKLKKMGLLKLDEEGDLPEDFDEAIKKLALEMSPSGKDGDESGDRSTDGERPIPPPSPKLSGNRKRGNKQDTDFQALTKKFPALLQKSGTPNV